jgi:hypothetical protein
VSGLRILVAIPTGWTTNSDFVKRITEFSNHPKHSVSILWELSATRLDMSLSKIIAVAKRVNPDVTLRFDSDCWPSQDLGTVVSLAREDFSRKFDLVYSPTRHVSGRIMSLVDDPATCQLCFRGGHLPELAQCTESHFGALGYSAISPRLIEAWRPHIVEYGPSPFRGGLRTVRYVCADWSYVDDVPKVKGFSRSTELREVDPDLNAHTPIFVVNPPDNSEDEDICFDVRSNGFKIGCDTRLTGFHLKRTAIPNYGSRPEDVEQAKATKERAKGILKEVPTVG